MKTSVILPALVLASSLLSACKIKINTGLDETPTGSSQKTTSASYIKKSYPIDGYTEIRASRGIRVHFTQSESYGTIRAEGPGRLFEDFEIRRKGDRLELDYRKRLKSINLDQGTIEVYLSAPAPDEIEVSSAAEFLAGRLVLADKLSLDASSAAGIHIDTLEADELEADASSAAKIQVNKSCKVKGEIEAEASSSAEIVLAGIRSSIVTAEASSAGTIRLKGATRDASFGASSAGDIQAEGLKAQVGQAQTSSGGSVRRLFVKDMGSQATSGGSLH